MDSKDQRPAIPTQSIPLREKVAFLKNKEHYPHPTAEVKAMKTHMSWVFLTDQFVYKLKIPFRLDHMRLLTSKARHQNCVQEIRLNKRLAEEFYLGVVPLSLDSSNNLVLGRGKRPVDWLVKMKRLPQEQMLDHRIQQNSVTTQDLESVAKKLTHFYITAEAVDFSASQYQEKLATALGGYHLELASSEFDLPKKKIDILFQNLATFIEREGSLLKQRVEQQKVIEGHGDLKPDHICLGPPAIIDCLEFSQELRILDVLDDLAFLALECDRLNSSWVGEYFIEHYRDHSGDPYSQPLVNFYKSYKAFIRALLSIRHIREEQYRDDPKWRKKTLNYLDLASGYIDWAL